MISAASSHGATYDVLRWHRGALLKSTILAALVAGLTGCSTATSPTPAGSAASTEAVKIALVTDFGSCDDGEAQVAKMVEGWNPRIIVTGGDNSQNDDNGCVGYQKAVGDYYGSYINAAGGPKFFPTLGNHDYTNPDAGLAAYNKFFSYIDDDSDSLRRWYVTSVESVEFFHIDTEVDAAALETQRKWLKSSLQSSKDKHPDSWRLVVMHRGPYTSGVHGPNKAVRPEAGWKYEAWGADVVIAGHQHVYDHYVVDGFNYITAGVGNGVNARECVTHDPGEKVCITGPGAMLIEASATKLTMAYHAWSEKGETVADTVEIDR